LLLVNEYDTSGDKDLEFIAVTVTSISKVKGSWYTAETFTDTVAEDFDGQVKFTLYHDELAGPGSVAMWSSVTVTISTTPPVALTPKLCTKLVAQYDFF